MGDHLIDLNEDGLLRVMSGGGLFIEAHPAEFFEEDTAVMQDFQLWDLLFESGLDLTRPDDIIMAALIRKA